MTHWYPRRRSPPIDALLLSRVREERWPPSELHHEAPDVSVLETDGKPPMIARWSRTSKSTPIRFSDNVDERFREMAKQTREQGN